MNVLLRPLVAADAAWADAWLSRVAASVGHEARDVASLVLRANASAGLIARAIERDGEPVGVLVADVGQRGAGGAVLELVAVAPEFARRGSGMRAAALVERELRGAGAARVYAPAPAVHGIAVYFWIRLGYHPLLQRDWPCERDGVAWMMRDLTA